MSYKSYITFIYVFPILADFNNDIELLKAVDRHTQSIGQEVFDNLTAQEWEISEPYNKRLMLLQKK